MSSKNYKLTNEQMEDLKAAFQLFDRDKNGCITVDEIGMVLQTFGHFYEKSDVIEMVISSNDNFLINCKINRKVNRLKGTSSR